CLTAYGLRDFQTRLSAFADTPLFFAPDRPLTSHTAPNALATRRTMLKNPVSAFIFVLQML
ncbi:MAG: hypothetical protein IJ268_04875, partial [Proteobacteria bacterium]|nr:hypothetical protein [Pseudomonadota bacterium]